MEHRRHVRALDGLRGLAIVLVFLCHWSVIAIRDHNATLNLPQKGFFALLDGGWCGVDLFFVLSGFLITGILLGTRERPRFFSNFYARRTLRIFPPYYLFLGLLFFALRPFASGQPNYDLLVRDQAWFWTYSVNWLVGLHGWVHFSLNHFWSLALEEQFYLFWPLVVFVAGTRGTAWLSAAIVLFSPLLRALLYYKAPLHAPVIFLYTSTFTRLDPLACGALIAAVLRMPGGRARLEGKGLPLMLGGAALFLALAIRAHRPDKADPAIAIVGYSGLALLFAGLLLLLVTLPETHWLSRAFSMRGLREIGKVSYVAYLVHMPLLIGADALTGQRMVPTVLLGALATLAVSFASWHLLERPLLNLKDRLAPPMG